MKSENAVEVRSITKSFKVYLDKGHTLKEKILFQNRRRYEERKVLNDISFNVKKGEAVGLIGHNGCGKSTILKLLTKIMYPDSGTIEMNGRVSSLLELGAGFHPDMSGRENIYINASILGLTRREIDSRAADIISFSELEDFIDNPVRTYSSGMYMRLAFSVAINVDAEILLIDEILAVGDAGFQAKCFNRLKEIKAGGTTIIIVSHSLGQIEQICDKTIWIHEGKIKKCGTPREVHPFYLDYMGQKQKARAEKKEERKQDQTASHRKEVGNYDVRITKVQLLDARGQRAAAFPIASKMVLRIDYEQKNENVRKSEIGFHIFRNDGMDCYGSNTVIDKVQSVNLKKSGNVQVEFDSVQLLQGKYKIDVAFHDKNGLTYHYLYDAVQFEILNTHEDVGVCRIKHTWFFDGKEP